MKMEVVFKFEMRDRVVPGSESFWIPECARFLRAGVQGEDIVIWWIAPRVEFERAVRVNYQRVIEARWTGASFDTDGLRYLDTVTTPNGLVWHLWEAIR